MIKGLKEDSAVLAFFSDITDIPRCSKNEEGISNYLLDWAKDRDLEVIQDDVNNIIIKKPASEGYEDEPTVVLQGHMDMVCGAVKGYEHDFCKDPIEAVVEGDRIIAKNTTLGADDGIAVAMMLAILDGDYKHPALECLITVDEETNMTGAHHVDGANIDGRVLINIDSEEEGIITVGCAGGLVNDIIFKKSLKDTDKTDFLRLNFGGFRGGHSGSDIHKERGNAIIALARILKEVSNDYDFDVADFFGGTRPNVIPQDAEAIIALDAKDVDGATKALTDAADVIAKEYVATDPEMHFAVEKVDARKVLDRGVSDGIINYLVLAPNGVNTFSKKIEGLVESSTNIGRAASTDDSITFTSQIRSDVETKILEIAMKNRLAGELNGAMYEEQSGYKPWEYAEESPLREKAVRVWKEMTGEEPTVEMIHAGLECGILQDSIGKMDMISIGPDMADVHTPGENLSISSTARIFEYLLKLLELKG
ncbi:MAG: aminoacyl-histidine dipeptidase [Peptoniphilus sp.]|nr:aminoacyl-histidine dipeptidase [Peptoniphilus sp.]MDD7363735.1 aminoacyl-histidine dipeptidase [Bacillota bacterium]MDY6044120.1 aminoacyl-histidine dipeptidase [Peptoniphilus sp.]